MLRTFVCSIALLLFVTPALNAEEPKAEGGDKKPAGTAGGGDKTLSGMAIVGNDDAPKALVIVPWKSSALGDALDVSRLADDGRQPVDREVFMRELDYYEIRAASSEGSAAQ